MLTRYKRRILALLGTGIWVAILVVLSLQQKIDVLSSVLIYIGGSMVLLLSVIVLNFNYMLYSYVFSKSLQEIIEEVFSLLAIVKIKLDF